MERINNIEELRQLSPNDGFYVIANGQCRKYIFCCASPVVYNHIIAVDDGSYKTSRVFSGDEIGSKDKVFLRGEYDSKKIGEIMIEQLTSEIRSVSDTYIKAMPYF